MVQYWTESPFYGTKFVSDLISRKRWKQIHSRIHVNVNFIQTRKITTILQELLGTLSSFGSG